MATSPDQIITEALDRYERVLISYAKEITGELESARDAVQETFLRLSRQDVAALEPRLRPWLFSRLPQLRSGSPPEGGEVQHRTDRGRRVVER